MAARIGGQDRIDRPAGRAGRHGTARSTATRGLPAWCARRRCARRDDGRGRWVRWGGRDTSRHGGSARVRCAPAGLCVHAPVAVSDRA